MKDFWKLALLWTGIALVTLGLILIMGLENQEAQRRYVLENQGELQAHEIVDWGHDAIIVETSIFVDGVRVAHRRDSVPAQGDHGEPGDSVFVDVVAWCSMNYTRIIEPAWGVQ